ncbi:MAG TPA: hypothetical protein VGH86_14310 [Phenylobacterium sp.]
MLVVPEADLWAWRHAAAAAGLDVLLFGFVWEMPAAWRRAIRRRRDERGLFDRGAAHAGHPVRRLRRRLLVGNEPGGGGVRAP